VNAKKFLTELKRRNVYKVAIAYAIVAWLLLQAASILFPTFEAPSWTMKVFVAVIALGFPIALVLAWAFELTPEGIKRAEDVDLSKSVRRKTGRKLDFFIIAVLLLVISVLLFQRLRPGVSPTVPPALEKSIAVLPFENLSEDKANAYFADGIQEEILTRLAKIADLKVISRTSTQRYQSKPGNLSEIGKQLGVANILEGSVQKAADQVRVNVQLVNAQTDSHLWADTYDRKLTDIFGVESEIAKAIAEQLQAKLTGREQQALAVKPTNNAEAYDAYLRGLAFDARGGISFVNEQRAAGFYERSVQLDPAFALAWGRLSRAESFLYFIGMTAAQEAAERALKAAQKLQPNAPETLLAQGYYQYWVSRDYELAKATFVQVRNVLPSSSDAAAALALIARRQGRGDESIDYWQQALVLDPRNSRWLADSAGTYAVVRQFPAALKTLDRALDIEPNDPDLIAAKAGIHQAEGDLEQAGKLLAGVDAHTASPGAFRTKISQLFLERHYDEAIRLLQIRLTESHEVLEYERANYQVSLIFAQRFAGDVAGARATAQQLQQAAEALDKKNPQNARIGNILLSLAYAALGQKDAALKHAERAMTLLPSSKDAVTGPDAEEKLARVEVMVGEKNRAIPRLQHLLAIPGAVYVQYASYAGPS
jgi:TolB-like protein/Tfp pilus assembly protein PilF